MPLNFVEPAASNSRVYGGLPPQLKAKLATQKLTENSHHDGIKPDTFVTNARLSTFYDVLTTNVDNTGALFVSSFEAKAYPIAGVQWHPEKNNFEWSLALGPDAIPHGADASAVSQYMANYVVSAARRSSHKFATVAEEAAALMYNYPAVPDPHGYFSQIYMFHRPPPPPQL